MMRRFLAAVTAAFTLIELLVVIATSAVGGDASPRTRAFTRTQEPATRLSPVSRTGSAPSGGKVTGPAWASATSTPAGWVRAIFAAPLAAPRTVLPVGWLRWLMVHKWPWRRTDSGF